MNHLCDVCRAGQGKACCRYLVGDRDGMHCAKLFPAIAEQLDARAAVGNIVALGDNCAGMPFDAILPFPKNVAAIIHPWGTITKRALQ